MWANHRYLTDLSAERSVNSFRNDCKLHLRFLNVYFADTIFNIQVVSCSRTPGHTKHFQTIFLTPSVRLCDSPGLVFPSLVNRRLQVKLKDFGGIKDVMVGQ